MSATSFQVIFDGPALRSSEMDVRELSSALVALNRVFEEADTLLNGGRTEHSLKVKGSFKTGSFKIDFTSYQGLLDKAKDLLNSENASAVIAAGDLVYFLIFGALGVGGGSVGLIGLLKWLKGQRPTKIVDDPKGGFRIYKGDKYVKAEEAVIRLYHDYKVRKALEDAINGSLKEDKVEEVAFTGDGGKSFEVVEYDEQAYFLAPPEEPAELHTWTYETNVSLIRISFREGNKWSVFDGANTIGAYVEDQKFLDKVNNNEIAFSKGTILVVRIRLEQEETPSGLKNTYFIEEVLDHRPPMYRGQTALKFDDTE